MNNYEKTITEFKENLTYKESWNNYCKNLCYYNYNSTTDVLTVNKDWRGLIKDNTESNYQFVIEKYIQDTLYIKKIYIPFFSGIHLLEQNLDKIDWKLLSQNPNAKCLYPIHQSHFFPIIMKNPNLISLCLK